MSDRSESEVERRRPDWWALESAVTERRDIVDELSDATGYFHDDDAARLREIASASGMKPVGIVKSAVEQAIENREWRCVYFDDSEERGYISSNAYEYYRIHRAFELEYEAALEALPTEENAHLREVPIFEHAADTLEDKARKHRAKREQAERFLSENGYELPEVEDPRPESDEPELVTDGGHDLGAECDVDECESRVVGLGDGWEVSRGTVCQDCIDYRDRHAHWPDEDPEICVECRLDEGAIRHECDEAAVDAVILNRGSACDYCGFEANVATDGGRVEADTEVPQKSWIENLLESLAMVEWDRFVKAEDDGLGVYFDIYGWIDREEDAYKDFILLRVFPETDENLRMFTTSSDRYHDEINEILFGDTGESNQCQRVEHTFEVPNVVELDEREVATDGGVDQSEAGADHWQVVEITGVGIGEMWFDDVADELTQREAERRAANRERYVAVPMPYDPDHEVPIGHVVDSYDRQVVENV